MKRSAGFTLVEFLIAIMVSLAVAAIYLSATEDRLDEKRSEYVVQETNEVLGAVQRWFAANGVLPGGAGCTTAIAVMQGAGTVSVADGANAFGNAMTPSCTATTFTLTQVVPEAWAAFVAARIPGTTAAGGTLTTRIGTGFTTGNMDTLLHRVAVPGRPDLNTLTVPLNFGGNTDVTNVGNISTRSGSVTQSMTVTGTMTVTNQFRVQNTSTGPSTLRIGELGPQISEIGSTGYACPTCPVGEGPLTVDGNLTVVGSRAVFNGGQNWSNPSIPNGSILSETETLIEPGNGIVRFGSGKFFFTDGVTSIPIDAFADTFNTTTVVVAAGTTNLPAVACGNYGHYFVDVDNPGYTSGLNVQVVLSPPNAALPSTRQVISPTSVRVTYGCRTTF